MNEQQWSRLVSASMTSDQNLQHSPKDIANKQKKAKIRVCIQMYSLTWACDVVTHGTHSFFRTCHHGFALYLLDLNSSRRHYKKNCFFQKKRTWYFMWTVSYGDTLHKISRPISWKTQNSYYLSSADFVPRVLNANNFIPLLMLIRKISWYIWMNKRWNKFWMN